MSLPIRKETVTIVDDRVKRDIDGGPYATVDDFRFGILLALIGVAALCVSLQYEAGASAIESLFSFCYGHAPQDDFSYILFLTAVAAVIAFTCLAIGVRTSFWWRHRHDMSDTQNRETKKE